MRVFGFGLAAVATVALGACAQMPYTGPLVTNDSPCVDSQFTVYFNEGSNRLTRPAAQMIQENGRRLRGCTITSARVVGLADATGTPQANLSLSQRRAAAVADAMKRQGMPSPRFEVDAGGEAGAQTADGHDAPVRRRAEVYLTVAPN